MKKNLPVLIDFDGVIRIGNKPAEDAEEFLTFLSKNKIPSHILSNSTLKISETVKSFLKENGIDSDIPVMTAADAALLYVKENYKKVSVFCNEEVKKIFKGFLTDSDPEAVVVGDLENKWSYEILNEIFRKVYNGADLIAMQKNKYWLPDGKNLSLDAGSFIKAIEFASSREAVLIGKPSPLYFKTALKALGFSQDSEFIMIGDDLETDINAAQKIGGKSILIYTGKTSFPLPNNLKDKPDFEAKNLKEIISILAGILN